MEIVPGLYQLKTPFPAPALPYIMPYVLIDSDGVNLVDAGFGTPAATEAMTRQLDELGYAPADIRRLFVTHAHPDHMGMASWVKEQSPDTQVIMLEREWQWIQERWLDTEKWTQLSDQWLVRHGVPQEEVDTAHASGALAPNARPGGATPAPASGARQDRPPMRFVEPDVKLQDGDVVELAGWRLQAVWTPGHTPGHMCLYETNHRLMFTGDHVLPFISPNVSLHADQEGTSPLFDFRESLKKVSAFDTTRALPAHEFTIADLPARCDELLHHHDERLNEVWEAISADGPTSARVVSQRVSWNTGPFDEFNIFIKRAALGETLSHLLYLEGEGRVRSVREGDFVLWEQVA
ncbi:MAG: MBL fold metallo-hydrolase [Chloroflexi bacterium]|nr:MBL fold metallo-hydrolase [Chloroflexota bacterium]